MSDVTYTVRDHSQMRIVLDVTGAPDTANPNLPGGAMVRPIAVSLLAWPNQDGVWEVTTVQVGGPKVQKNGSVTTRTYDIPFTSPLDEGSPLPEWLRKIVLEWTTQINGGPAEPGVVLTDEQVYDLNNRLQSNLGLQPTRKVLEDVLGGTPVARPQAKPEPTNHLRGQFDSMLNALLIAENLAGTEWAIQQIREAAAEAKGIGHDMIAVEWQELAGHLEQQLDKRTAQLAAREG